MSSLLEKKRGVRKDILTRTFLVVCSSLVFLLMAEGLLRIHGLYLEMRYGPESPEEILWCYDARLGWKLCPNQKAYFSLPQHKIKTLCQINSRGLRDDEYSYPKPADTLRILLLGDSILVGMEVEKEKVVDAVLEGLINPIRPCEVINAGVRGYGTDQSLLFLTHEGIRYDPDIVLYLFAENDPEDNITIHRPWKRFGKSYFLLENDALTLKGVPVPFVFDPPQKWLMSSQSAEDFYNASLLGQREVSKIREVAGSLFPKLKWFLKNHSILYRKVIPALRHIERVDAFIVKVGLAYPKEFPVYQRQPTLSHETWQITGALIKAMRSFCDERDIPFAVFEYTDGLGKSGAQKTTLEKITDRLNIEYIESIRHFYHESQGTPKLIFKEDGHWNAKGHELAAGILFQHLERIGWISSATKEGRHPDS